MSFILGSPVEGSPRPSFHALLEGQQAIVELDSGAVFRLAEQATPKEIARILDGKRDIISEAAARLVGGGFVTRRGDSIEILITALDL